MDTTTLRTFIALAQIKNFTKTAQQLFVAQSTVTNRIRDLEMELGVPPLHPQPQTGRPDGVGSKIPRLCPTLRLSRTDGPSGYPVLADVRPKSKHRYDQYDLRKPPSAPHPQLLKEAERRLSPCHYQPYGRHDAPAPRRDPRRHLFLQCYVQKRLRLPALPDRLIGPGL